MMGTEERHTGRDAGGVDNSMFEASLAALDRQAELGTFLSKRSHIAGWVDLYSPEEDFSLWSSRPWVLKVEKGIDTGGPTTYKLDAKYAHEAYKHIGLLSVNKEAWAYKLEPLIPTVAPDLPSI